jgi:hypothetical protein
MAIEDVPPLLIKSVPPIFYSGERDRPERAGTCVLLNVFGCPVIASAAHALRKVGDRLIWVMPPAQNNLVPLGAAATFCTDDEDEPQGLDVGFIPCTPQHVSTLEAAGFSFVREAALDTERRPHDAEYVVIGWPESPRQCDINPVRRHIDQHSFEFWTGEVSAAKAQRAGESPDSHLVLEFNPKKVSSLATGHRTTPPNPVGVSGGVAAYGNQSNQGALRIAGLMVRKHETHRVMVATRMSEFLGFVQHVRELGYVHVR